LQAIDSVHSPDFFLDLHISGTPAAPVRGKRLGRRLEGWLRTLDYEEAAASWGDNSRPPPIFTYE